MSDIIAFLQILADQRVLIFPRSIFNNDSNIFSMTEASAGITHPDIQKQN